MTLLYFLTLFPLVPAIGMLLARSDRARDAVGLVGSGIIMAVTVVVAVLFFGMGPQGFEVAPGTSHVLSIISSVVDVILCAVILYNAFKYRNALTGVLGVVQLGIPYVLLGRASGACPPLACSLLGAVEPLLNPVWVFIFDGEAPGLWALIGGVVVVATITVWCVYGDLRGKKAGAA